LKRYRERAMKGDGKRLVCKCIKITVFLGILLALFLSIQHVLVKDTGHRGSDVVKGFYAEERESIDVVFLGSSTMFCTADPLVLYEEYGIASYDFGCSAQPFVSEYLYLKEVLRYQHPKVVGLEVVSIKKESDPSDLEGWTYAMTDLRFSLDKMTELYRLLHEEKEIYAMQMLPILQYKDRWKELTWEDFGQATVNYTKGAYTPDKITENPLDFSTYFEDSGEIIPQENKDTLEKIVTLCQQEGIELFLWKGPNIGWTITDTRQVEQLAQEYGLPFLNYFDLLEELDVDPVKDFRDFSHFNRFGSRKASLYLGEYLKERYELPDRREEDVENSWDVSLAERAHDRANEALSKTPGLDAYLNLIPYPEHTVVFSFRGDTEELSFYRHYLAVLLNLDEAQMKGDYSIVVENGLCTEGVLGQGSEMEHRLGKNILLQKKLVVGPDGVEWGGERDALIQDGLTVWVYDNAWNQLVDWVGFASGNVDEGVRVIGE